MTYQGVLKSNVPIFFTWTIDEIKSWIEYVYMGLAELIEFDF